MPNWLDGRTIAMVTTTITAALALAMMIQTAHSRLGNDINKLDDRLRSVEVGIATLQTTMAGFESRLRVVERDADDASAFDGSGG